MSRTPVSEFNARMGLDISPLEQAVPRATALLRKLSSVQAEAFAAQSGGPDMQAMTERMRSASKSAQRLGLGGGGTATFKDPASAQEFTDPIGAAHEASLKRTALRQQEMQRAQKAASDAYMADIRMIDAALEQTAARQMQTAQERQDFEESIAQRRIASAQTINEFETQRSTLIRNSAKESAAAFQADFRATEARLAAEENIAQRRITSAQSINEFETQRSSLIQNSAKESAAAFQADFRATEARLAAEQEIAQRRIASAQSINEFETQRSSLIRNSARESAAAFQEDFRAAQADIDAALQRQGIENEIAEIRRRAAQVQATSRFDLANPFQQQVLAVQELNRLMVVRRGLQRGSVEFAQAELRVVQQIARVRSIRDNLTAGAEGMRRLGNTAADNQGRFARFGLGMQQVGYQVQDFAVQIASGTNTLTALSQQGSQLLGFFGGFRGAIAGAVLSVGILVYKLLDTKEATKEALKELSSMSKELIKINQSRNARQIAAGPLSGQVEDAFKSLQIAEKVVKLKKSAVAFDAKTQSTTAKGGFFGESESMFGKFNKYLPLSALSILGAKAIGYDALTISTGQLVAQTGNLVDAERELNDVQARGQQILDNLILLRENLLNTLDRNRKPLVDEKELQSLIKVGAITEKQAQQTRLLAEYSKSRSEWSRPDNEFTTLDLLAKQLDYLKQVGLEKTEAFKETKDEFDSTNKSLDELAKKYKDQLDPLYEQKRVWKEISDLRKIGKLTAEEATEAQAKILKDINLARKLPDALSNKGGVLSSGLMVGAASPNQLIDISRQMLKALQNLVSLETAGVRG
jgi:hypothetical protein